MTVVLLFALSALIFFPLDFLWLRLSAEPIYRHEIGHLLSDSPNLVVAGLFYVAYVAGLVLLVSIHSVGDPLRALLLGAVLGFIAYGTYDLTNLSTMNGFTTRIAVIDMAWGTALTAVTAAGGVWLHSLLT